FYAVARRCWAWSKLRAGAIAGLFLVVDLAFFGANLAKLFHGGWFPMVAALAVFSVMTTGRMGARWRFRELAKIRVPFADLYASLKLNPPLRVKGTAVFMTQDLEGTPPAMLHQLKHNQVLHEQVVILTIQTRPEPVVPIDERVEVIQLGRGYWRVIGRYGFMETPNVRRPEARGHEGPRHLHGPHQLLPGTRHLRRDGTLQPAGLAPGALHVPRPQRPPSDGVLRHPSQRRGRAGRADRGVRPAACRQGDRR